MPTTMPIMTCVARPRFPVFCFGALSAIVFSQTSTTEDTEHKREDTPGSSSFSVTSVLRFRDLRGSALSGALKQRPELENVLDGLDGKHSVDELLASGGSE